MKIEPFFDNITNTFTYIIIDPETNSCAIIDSVQDYDASSGKTGTTSTDKIIKFIQDNQLNLEWILETHIHADHLTGAHYIKSKLGGKIGIGEHILQVLEYWVPIFNIKTDTPTDASQFDRLFKDGETFAIGNLSVKILHTPGHTSACVSYIIEDAIFVGDSIFMPHLGTARVDFPGGSAETLYESIQKILSLPDATRIFVCHDYPKENEKAGCLSTVKEQRESNIFINENITKEEYIKTRIQRDKTLPVPRLLLPSIQTNMRAGKLPMAEDNNVSYIKIPLNQI
ncbi:MAG: MBL fold metallo-hydrolase [Rickettsiaceae bacterium]|nr:MBL fold metallo-hydrolase [Rickettsiaceae bacterium]MDP5083041.1 MBL fold metallo-hydrolase [Rickettsiaceae bacterium]